jgi:hypothetical protein
MLSQVVREMKEIIAQRVAHRLPLTDNEIIDTAAANGRSRVAPKTVQPITQRNAVETGEKI